MHSKTSGLCPERPKPWNYERLGYNLFWQHFDGTTKRFNDNTKIIVVEGPPGNDYHATSSSCKKTSGFATTKLNSS